MTISKMREEYFRKAAEVARTAKCQRRKSGAIIVLNDEVIGEGAVGPAPGDRSRCQETRNTSLKPKYEKTCCVHSEWRAIINAMKVHGDITGASLYFARVNDEGELQPSGNPFCTTCSRLASEVGLKDFGLWHEDGIKMYDTVEYNNKSYSFYVYPKES